MSSKDKDKDKGTTFDLAKLPSSAGNLAELLNQLQTHSPTTTDTPEKIEGPVPLKLWLSQGVRGHEKLREIPGDTKYNTTGMMFIGTQAGSPDGIFFEPIAEEQAKEGNLGKYDAVVRAVLVEAMTTWSVPRTDGNNMPKGRRHAQRMPLRDDSGQTVTPIQDACKSNNGFYPVLENIGKTVHMSGRGQSIKIGYKMDENTGELVPIEDIVQVGDVWVPDICGQCPASLFRREQNGKPFRYCDPQPVYVLYIFPFNRGDGARFDGGLVEVFASNSSMSNAFLGVRANSYGHLTEGKRGITGVEDFYNVKTSKVLGAIRSVESLKPVHYQHIVALVPVGKTPEAEAVLITELITDEVSLVDLLTSDMYESAVLAVETFLAYPEGKPEIVGDSAVVHAVQITTEFNSLQDGKTNTSPVFTMEQQPLSDEDLAVYMKDVVPYLQHTPSHRSYRMGLSNDVLDLYREAITVTGSEEVGTYPPVGPRRVNTQASTEEDELEI